MFLSLFLYWKYVLYETKQNKIPSFFLLTNVDELCYVFKLAFTLNESKITFVKRITRENNGFKFSHTFSVQNKTPKPRKQPLDLLF